MNPTMHTDAMRFRLAAGWAMFTAGLAAGIWATVVFAFINPAMEETRRYLMGWDVVLICVGGLGLGALVLAMDEQRRRGGGP